ncbi:MAG: DUF2163 domain-containing protein [Rickettsiales bacterium]
MRPITPNLTAHLQGEVTTLATCWKITRTDGVVKTFTDLDSDIVFASLTYLSIAGFTPSSVETKDNFSVDNVEVQGMFQAGYITAPDLLAGKYDFAEVEIFIVNYLDLSQGRMLLRRGRLGEVTMQKDTFIAELRGLAENLQQTIGELYQPSCRAILGDSECKKVLTSFTFTGTVTTVTSGLIFTSNALTQAAGYFTGGQITWTSGNNNGLKMEVKEFANKQVVLAQAMPYAIQVGNIFQIIAGCDKTHQTCISKFNNIINFRGEPFVPGTDAISKTAGTMDR